MIDLIVVGDPFPYMGQSIPEKVNIIVEQFDDSGYNAALNRGVKKSSADYIGFCNNDLIFHEGSISYLLYALQRGFDSVSPWCPKTHYQWWGNERPKDLDEGYQTGKRVSGWCIFMHRKTWETIGGFDERVKFWASDNAYSEQLYQAKLKHALVYNAKVTHEQSQTLNKLEKSEYDKLTDQQVKLFKQLYGFSCFDKRYKA